MAEEDKTVSQNQAELEKVMQKEKEPEREIEPEKQGKQQKQEQKKEKDKKQEQKKEKEKTFKQKKSFGEWYDKNHKLLLFISIAFLVACIIYLFIFYIQTGDIMNKDITLTGGTLLTVFTDQEYNLVEMEKALASEIGDAVIVRSLRETYSNKQIAITIETKAEAEVIEAAAEKFLGLSLNEDNSSIEMTGTALSESFYKELLGAIALAFVFMSIVVMILFRKEKSVVPAIAVIQAALLDIVFALAMSNILGLRMSTAGIAALLMLIGYSVDTDIMLTNKVLKRHEGTINSRIKGAFKTGIVMTLTSLIAVLVAYFFIEAVILKQMFLIILFGLTADLISTWFGNAAILKWYAERKK